MHKLVRNNELRLEAKQWLGSKKGKKTAQGEVTWPRGLPPEELYVFLLEVII